MRNLTSHQPLFRLQMFYSQIYYTICNIQIDRKDRCLTKRAVLESENRNNNRERDNSRHRDWRLRRARQEYYMPPTLFNIYLEGIILKYLNSKREVAIGGRKLRVCNLLLA